MDHQADPDRRPEGEREALMVLPDDEGMPTPRALEAVSEAADPAEEASTTPRPDGGLGSDP